VKKAFTWIATHINTQAFTNLYDSLLFVIDFIVSRTSDSLAGILIKALPLLAPVPNAVSVWRISQHAPLNYDTLQAGALAASVEGLFFALTAVALDMFDGYLIDKNRYVWPLRIAGGLLISFFVLVEVIVLFIETNPVAMAFPVISLIAAVGLGCSRWHLRNQKTPQFVKAAKVAKVKVEAEPQPQTLNSVTPILSENTADKPADNLSSVERMNAARQLKIDTRRSTILNFLRETELPISEIANRLDVSTNTIRKDLEALQSAGHSMSVNGVVKLA
jgi:hypothetical protein